MGVPLPPLQTAQPTGGALMFPHHRMIDPRGKLSLSPIVEDDTSAAAAPAEAAPAE